MKLFHVIIPHLTISLALAVVVVIYVNNRNPMMGFFSGAPAAILLGAFCLCALITAVVHLSSRK